MQYSPKLKRAMEQIKKILKDNDIGGYVTLHTPEHGGHSEYLIEITPKYSCIEWSPQMDKITIKGKLEHYNGDKGKRDKKLNETINMLHHLSTMTMEHGLMLAKVSDQADKAWEAEHKGGGGHTSHNQQNN